MPISHEYSLLPCTSIKVDREGRQRRVVNTAGLKDSIALRGVLQPIIIDRDLNLIAGERRLTASKELGLLSIPCRYIEDLDPFEAMIVELEENVKRSDLTWADTTQAVFTLHSAYVEKAPGWTQNKTAEALAMSPSDITRYLRVGSELQNPRIAGLTSLETAYNMLKRQDERRAGDAVSSILAASHLVIPGAPNASHQPPASSTLPTGSAPAAGATSPPIPSTESAPILHIDFSTWLTTYSDLPFNFLHCDFPYGINVFDGQYGDAAGEKHYDDSPDVYFSLIKLLADNLDRVVAHSAHVMFWFSMEHYVATMAMFTRLMPDVVWQRHPLVWVKSDNVGIMPDPRRGPRRVYETCLIGTRGDRPLVKPVSNAYVCPTDKQYHPSTKPEPMLRHFFQMFVDNGTRLLDPTCGSASALRAAHTLGAEQILGLEQDPEHFAVASKAMTTFYKLRNI